MSIKNLYLPAQSGKIRMENGVYCGLKGVKSMIEVIYKEETDTTKETAEYVKLPNNVRQIGEIKGKKKIYMEDYVYTFLKKIARNPHGDEVAAILFGSCHWTGQGDYIFIRSALQIRDLELSPEHIRFDDKVWGQVYEDSKKYFPFRPFDSIFLQVVIPYPLFSASGRFLVETPVPAFFKASTSFVIPSFFAFI